MLNNIKMNVIQTAKNGIVNEKIIFHFTQNEKTVEAIYSAGKIERVYLVGLLEESILKFTYCQLRKTDQMDHGKSKCVVSKDASSGILMMKESFDMKTENSDETGINIFMEI